MRHHNLIQTVDLGTAPHPDEIAVDIQGECVTAEADNPTALAVRLHDVAVVHDPEGNLTAILVFHVIYPE